MEKPDYLTECIEFAKRQANKQRNFKQKRAYKQLKSKEPSIYTKFTEKRLINDLNDIF